MRRSLLIGLAWLLSAGTIALPFDLAKTERPAVKLPELRSGAAQYCLLVFGPEAREKVWLVHDGDRLYVDRNGNGDLTEPGETVSADPQETRPGVYSFKAGDLPSATGVHKDLQVGWYSIEHIKDDWPALNARLNREPGFRGCSIRLDADLPGFKGTGIDGRVQCLAGPIAPEGLLEFAPRPEEAPILHFGGPWQIGFYDDETWRIGRKAEAVLALSTPGLGPGTSVLIGYENVVPKELKPLVEVTWPAVAGSAPRISHFELANRCCTVNLYGDLLVPADVPQGLATVRISLPDWPAAQVAATRHEVKVEPPPAGLKREPVSARLARKLDHEHPDGSIVAIEFSPDGRRLIAGDYPGGLVHVWDVASGGRLASFDTGKGFRSSYNYFVVTDGWKKILAPTNNRGSYERFEREGKALSRVAYDGSIRVWDLESGRLIDHWKTDPPRSTLWLQLSPDRLNALALEETPGEFESSRPRAVGLWDIETGQHRQLFAGPSRVEAFSNDAKQAIVAIAGEPNFTDSLTLYDVPSWQATGLKIPLKPLQRCHSLCFLEKTPMMAGTVHTNPSRNDYANSTAELKFWSLSDGTESWSYGFEKGESPSSVVQTPDHGPLYVTTSFRGSHGRLLRVDLAAHEVRVVFDEPRQVPWPCVLHPGGKWMAVTVREFPESAGTRDLPLEEWPQPHLQIRDVATGELLEDLVAPPCYMNSLAFSPDGDTLATSGEGAVLLWDFSDSPGRSAPAVVGQKFTAVGTLVDGKPLDWSAYRGKVVLVTYWATWCQPCVAEIPELKKVYHALHDRGFEVLAISVDRDRGVLERFLDSEKLPWQVVCAPGGQEGRLDHPLARRHGVDTIPKTFLIDRQGTIAAIDARGAELGKLVEELLTRYGKESPQ
ncbi:MAG TPA: redoxin domain-containing protein [Pirellulales bacterium]|jgi:WD40 repeat protein|nr:redoxin domain-containing protein [Pirellulales bacterium]